MSDFVAPVCERLALERLVMSGRVLQCGERTYTADGWRLIDPIGQAIKTLTETGHVVVSDGGRAMVTSRGYVRMLVLKAGDPSKVPLPTGVRSP